MPSACHEVRTIIEILGVKNVQAVQKDNAKSTVRTIGASDEHEKKAGGDGSSNQA